MATRLAASGNGCILTAPLTVVGLLRFLLATVLLASAGGKLVSGRSGREALRSYGIRWPAARAALWGGAIVAEIVLAIGVALDVRGASEAAASLMAFFALALAAAILRGRAGAPVSYTHLTLPTTPYV